MGKLLIAVIMIFAFMGIAFADVGPAPPAPNIEVSLFKNGALYTDEASVAFHCVSLEPEGESPVGNRDVNLTCSNGICKNEDWFYKFNPCYTPDNGVLRYKLKGWDSYKETGSFNFSNPVKYEIVLDVDNGNYTTTSKTGCLGMIALAGIVGLLAFAKHSLGK